MVLKLNVKLITCNSYLMGKHYIIRYLLYDATLSEIIATTCLATSVYTARMKDSLSFLIIQFPSTLN